MHSVAVFLYHFLFHLGLCEKFQPFCTF